MNYLKTYLKTITDRGNIDLARSIEQTAAEVGDKYIQDFNFCEHRIGLWNYYKSNRYGVSGLRVAYNR